MFSLFDSLSVGQHSLQHHSSITPDSQGLAVGPGALSSPKEQAWQVWNVPYTAFTPYIIKIIVGDGNGREL